MNIVTGNIYEIRKLEKLTDIEVAVPGSKSITNRALLIAALAEGTTTLDGVLFSDDSRYFLEAIKTLGFSVMDNEDERSVVISGACGKIPKGEGEIYVGSAGTAARFLTAMAGLSGGKYVINASEQMKKRPMKPLFKVLEDMGVKIEYMEEPYFLPVRILGREELKISQVTLDTSESTQYLSAILMTGVMNSGGISVKVTGSRKTGSYVNITRKMMEDFGCKVEYKDDVYTVRSDSKYSVGREFKYMIEPDVSAACYFYGIAAITGIGAVVKNVYMDSMQGDIKFVDVLKNMGCNIEELENGIKVTGPKKGKLNGVRVDMKDFSDQALTLAAISIFADGTTTIKNIGHIRKQECDRLNAMTDALGRMGVRCDADEDSIKIYPSLPEKCSIETYDDHRVAMSFTLPGLVTGNISILNPMCCRKTFKDYFEIIDKICQLV